MRDRREFSTKTKLEAFDRAGGKCEICSARLGGRVHYDHRIPDALGGSNTSDNCSVLCVTCHGLKTTKEDVPTIAKSKRTRAKHANASEKRPTFRKAPAGYDPWRRQWRQ